MPPAVATDHRTEMQSVWNDGWIYKGLTTAVRLLRRLDHPLAAEMDSEAGDYRRAFVRAFRAKAETMPTWRDASGREHRFVPLGFLGVTGRDLRHAFYIDTGPLFLVFSGLLGVEDDLMESALKWFREGPPTRMYRHDTDFRQLPSLFH